MAMRLGLCMPEKGLTFPAARGGRGGLGCADCVFLCLLHGDHMFVAVPKPSGKKHVLSLWGSQTKKLGRNKAHAASVRLSSDH